MVGWCSLKGSLIVSHKHSLHWLYVGDHPNWITAFRGLDPSISSPHFAPSTRLRRRHEHGEQVIGRRQYAQLHAMSCYASADMFLAFFWPVCARFSVLALSDSDWRSIQPGHFKKAGRSQQAEPCTLYSMPTQFSVSTQWALHASMSATPLLGRCAYHTAGWNIVLRHWVAEFYNTGRA